jgi:hypothetical protein
MTATLIASHTTSGRVLRVRHPTREQCWDQADRILAGWLARVRGSRYWGRDACERITGPAPGVSGSRPPWRFEVTAGDADG